MLDRMMCSNFQSKLVYIVTFLPFPPASSATFYTHLCTHAGHLLKLCVDRCRLGRPLKSQEAACFALLFFLLFTTADALFLAMIPQGESAHSQ